VAFPTIPSSFNPFAFCQDLTAASVLGPNVPVVSTPNFSWSFFTSSPDEPHFSTIIFYFPINSKSTTKVNT
jgi:hypothetical protein